MADAINSAVAPFQNAPPPEQGAAGWVAQGLGGVLGLIGAPQQLIDNAFAGLTAPIAALFPAMPAVTLLGMHIGMLHTHTHPPSLIPPAPPVPLPSIGMLVGAGSMAVLGCGMPLARAGDMGISVTCGSLAPPFEVFTGSSNVFVGGARAARVLDITKHCDPTTMGPFGIAMAVAGVAAGAAGAIATNAAAQAAQAAADAAVLALKLLAGKDPGLPPGIGALVGPPLPNVLIGGFPCPPIGDMVIGALMKGLKRLAQAVKKLRSSRRANGHCANGSHPIYLVTGENFDHFTDFVSPGLFRWQRYYTTAHARIDGPLGFGFRHCYQRHLDLRLHQATFIDWDGVELEFPKFEGPPGSGRDELREHGYVLRRVEQDSQRGCYELSTRGQPTMLFEGDRFTEVLPLVGLRSETHELRLEYDAQGRLVRAIDTELGSRTAATYQLSYDELGRITAIHELGSSPVARARMQEKLEARRRERQRKIEADEHGRIVDNNRQKRDSGELDRRLDSDDRAYIDDERALSRASDPDKGISDKTPGSAIDEARAMDHAETTGQLPGPVERSVRPGADVKTGTGDGEQHYSMKGVVSQDHAGSQARASKEIDNMAADRRRGNEPNGVLVDLRHSPDPAGDRARLQQHADTVNEGLVNDGHQPIDVRFIDP